MALAVTVVASFETSTLPRYYHEPKGNKESCGWLVGSVGAGGNKEVKLLTISFTTSSGVLLICFTLSFVGYSTPFLV